MVVIANDGTITTVDMVEALPPTTLIDVCSVPLKTFGWVQHFRHVKVLRFARTAIDDTACMNNCVHLVHLEELDLTSTSVIKLDWISSLAELRRIKLRRTKITTLEPLCHLQKLQVVDVGCTRIRQP